MAIEKNYFKVLRMDSELSLRSKESMSSDDDEFSKGIESDDDDEFDDCDSGAGSDDFDLLELGETGEEFVQVGNQTCSIPFELYDLSGFGDILSMDVWNDCLTEEERFSLTKYLPDMDQEMFMRTLKELFTGCNIHFGSPIDKMFDMFKGGLCEPRVALYRQGMSFFQNCRHYHLLQKHQNSMVTSLYQIMDAWNNYKGYSIEEKLQVLNIMKTEKSLLHENMEELGTDSSGREEPVDSLTMRGKNRKTGEKTVQYPGQRLNPTMNFSSRGRQTLLEPAVYGKHNPKGTLKVSRSKKSTTNELTGPSADVNRGIEMDLGPYGSALAPLRQNKASGYDSGTIVRMRDQLRGHDDAEDAMYEVAVQGSGLGPVDKAGTFKMGKKYEQSRDDEHSSSFMALPTSLNNDFSAYSRNQVVNQLSDIEALTTKPSKSRLPYEYGKKLKFPETMQQVGVEDQMEFRKVRPLKFSVKGSQDMLTDGGNQFWPGNVQGDPIPIDLSNSSDRIVKTKKLKLGGNYPDSRADILFQSGYDQKSSQDRKISMHNGQHYSATTKSSTKRSDETESGSSVSLQSEENEDDDNPLMRSKLAYPSGISSLKSLAFPKNTKFVKKGIKRNAHPDVPSKLKMADEHFHMAEGDIYTLQAKQRGTRHVIQPTNHTDKGTEYSLFPSSGSVNINNDEHDWGERYKSAQNDRLLGEQGERFSMPSLKSYPSGRRQKAETMFDYPQSSYLQDYVVDDKDETYKVHKFSGESGLTGRVRKKDQHNEAYGNNYHDTDLQLSEYNSLTKKRKVKDELSYMNKPNDTDGINQKLNDTTPSRKQGKRKLENDRGTSKEAASELPAMEVAAGDADTDKKVEQKPFTLITPSVHTGFSFSVVHLLSAVRMAMITLLPDDSVDMVKHLDGSKQDEGSMMDINNLMLSRKASVPSLTVQDIVNRVKLNPGDPCILDTQEPLQDLIRGVLKIFSSKTAPLGAKSWKTLVLYEKARKSWSWIGPTGQGSDQKVIEEVTSPEAWGLPHKMLVKLVDSFANWLKSSQETLQQIGSLPAPPLALMQINLDEKERFRDLRAQKSLNTINTSSDEVRNYFRKEEVIRYSVPDRAYSYIAIDGRKSIVAPLRRCGGKPTSKARDHFMLKRDRPPHVTILCLVRDAAARLPGSIGTRADVCTLIRDSQYIVEDVSDAQVNQVVSGALDRLHYERDPCVQFDGERKLWVYLHREREEEDFEDDGTSSTKKWKRQKKETVESSEQGTVTVAYHGNEDEDQNRFDLSSDLNLDPSCTNDDKGVEILYYDDRHHIEDKAEGLRSEQADMHPGPPMVWEALGLNPVQQNKILCEESSTNEAFDGEIFGREQPDDLLSTGLS